MKRLIVAALCAATLSGCQSNYTYEPIVPNAPNREMAEAQCQMMSTSAQSGFYASGTRQFVAGAAIGNAIGNAIAMDNFVRQCMVMNGWRRVTIKPQPRPQARAASVPSMTQGMSSQTLQDAKDATGIKHIASKCGVKLPPKVDAEARRLSKLITAAEKAESVSRAEGVFNGRVKKGGRKAACDEVRTSVNEINP